MKFKPLDDRLLVLVPEAKTMTDSGIHLPESSTEKPFWGKVVAVGPGRWHENGDFDKASHRVPMSVAVGDSVYFDHYAGAPIELDEGDFTVLREAEVMGVLPKTKK